MAETVLRSSVAWRVALSVARGVAPLLRSRPERVAPRVAQASATSAPLYRGDVLRPLRVPSYARSPHRSPVLVTRLDEPGRSARLSTDRTAFGLVWSGLSTSALIRAAMSATDSGP